MPVQAQAVNRAFCHIMSRGRLVTLNAGMPGLGPSHRERQARMRKQVFGLEGVLGDVPYRFVSDVHGNGCLQAPGGGW